MRRPGKATLLKILTGLALVAAPTVALAPAASASTTFSNTTSIGLSNAPQTGCGGTCTAPGPASLYPSPITVSGTTGTISNLTVSLEGINWSYSQDLSVLLVGPSGKAMTIFSNVGSNDQSTATTNLDVTLDDSSSNTYPYNSPSFPTSGSVTMQPRDNTDNPLDSSPIPPADSFPSPAPALGAPPPTRVSTPRRLGQPRSTAPSTAPSPTGPGPSM